MYLISHLKDTCAMCNVAQHGKPQERSGLTYSACRTPQHFSQPKEVEFLILAELIRSQMGLYGTVGKRIELDGSGGNLM